MIEDALSHDHFHSEWEQPTRKRVRLTPPEDDDDTSRRPNSQHGPLRTSMEHSHTGKDQDKSMTIASTAKLASQAVAPFFAKHIPSQYAPLGDPNREKGLPEQLQDPNSKFCYRHRPDMLCRRQADEPTMDKLQKELEGLPQEDRQGIVQVWSLFSAAPSKHRNLMLQGILAQCCFPQLSFLSANVRELIRIDFIAALPNEIAFRILCYLDPTSLCKAAQVSRKWRQIADDDVVWHRMCEQHIDRKCTKCGWGLPLLEAKRLRSTKRQIQLRASGQGLDDTSSSHMPGDIGQARLSDDSSPGKEDLARSLESKLPPSVQRRPPITSSQSEIARKTRPWKDVYKDRFRVGTNWKYGRYSIKILRGHTNGIMAMQMYDNILATGSYDDTIKIWDVNTGEELRTLRGHTMGIRAIQIDDTKLISGSLDKTLKVWNWRTGECKGTYSGHSEGVIGLHFDSNILVSASIDRTARVWNFKDKTQFSLRGHTDWVNSVRIDTPSRTVFTASDDCTVKLWDLDTRRCIRTFEGHVCQVQSLVLLPPEFDALDETMPEIPLQQQQQQPSSTSNPGSPTPSQAGSSFSGHQPSPTLTTRTLLPAALNPDLLDPFSMFDPDRPRPPRYMLTSALDSTIRLWEVPTGRCIRTFFGHLEGVWALAADTLRIVSGAEDRMVKVWDPRSGKCERTFTGHRGPVTCIALSDSRMCSAGEDGEVRVYSFRDQ